MLPCLWVDYNILSNTQRYQTYLIYDKHNRCVDPPAAGEAETSVPQRNRPKSSKPDPVDETEEATSTTKDDEEKVKEEEMKKEAAKAEAAKAAQAAAEAEAAAAAEAAAEAAAQAEAAAKAEAAEAPSAAEHRAAEAHFDNIFDEASTPLKIPGVTDDEDDGEESAEGGQQQFQDPAFVNEVCCDVIHFDCHIASLSFSDMNHLTMHFRIRRKRRRRTRRTRRNLGSLPCTVLTIVEATRLSLVKMVAQKLKPMLLKRARK